MPCKRPTTPPAASLPARNTTPSPSRSAFCRPVKMSCRPERAGRSRRHPDRISLGRRRRVRGSGSRRVARLDGPTAAARRAIASGRLADRIEKNRGWWFGRLAAAYRTSLDGDRADAVQLLAWEVEEAERPRSRQPRHRRRLSRTALHERRRGTASNRAIGPAHTSTRAPLPFLADYRQPVIVGTSRARPSPGPASTGRLPWLLRPYVDRFAATGQISRAVTFLGMLGRLHLALGELDAAADIRAPRPRAGSPTRARLRTPPSSSGAWRRPAGAGSRTTFSPERRQCGVWWAGDARRHALGVRRRPRGWRRRPGRGLVPLRRGRSRGCPRASCRPSSEQPSVLRNYITIVSSATQILWWTARTDPRCGDRGEPAREVSHRTSATPTGMADGPPLFSACSPADLTKRGRASSGPASVSPPTKGFFSFPTCAVMRR